MPQYYIIDSTINQNGKNPVLVFDTTAGVIARLEEMCKRRFNMTRAQYMNEAESIGHSADEPTGRAFYEQMEQYFNIGVIRNGKEPVKTNIFQAEAFLKTKDVHGN
jgi:hypothetical protein